MTYTSTVKYFKDETLFSKGIFSFTTPTVSPAQVDADSPVYHRAAKDFCQRQYMYPAPPVFLGVYHLHPPKEPVYALRLLIRAPQSDMFIIPGRLRFLETFIKIHAAYQARFFPGYEDRFVYLTVRSGPVISSRDDEFHVDGFQGVSVPRHIPEQNYLWACSYPTLFSLQSYFVESLDPGKHNIHDFFEAHTDKKMLYTGVERGVYIVDPYHVHARQELPQHVFRTVIRLTFSPVEIRDDTNTANPYIPRNPYHREDVRNFLISYGAINPELAHGLQRVSL